MKQYLTSLAAVAILGLGLGCKSEEEIGTETFQFGYVSVNKDNFSRENYFDGFQLNSWEYPILFRRNLTRNEDTLYRGDPEMNYYDTGCDGSIDRIATAMGNSYRRADGRFPDEFRQGDLLIKQFKEAFKINDGCYNNSPK